MTTPTASCPTVPRVLGLAVGAPALAAVTAVAASRAWILLGSRGRVLTVAQAPARDVAIVLGAGLRPDGRPSDYLAARLDLAIELVRAGRAALVVVSGAAPEGADEPAAMRRYLLEHGVAAERVVEDRAGVDTYATCCRARQVYGIEEVLLVSQAYHLPRALAVARACGLDAVGVGDRSVLPLSRGVTWAWGEVREWLAGVKAVGDLVRPRREDHRDHDPAVQDALARVGRTTLTPPAGD